MSKILINMPVVPYPEVVWSKPTDGVVNDLALITNGSTAVAVQVTDIPIEIVPPATLCTLNILFTNGASEAIHDPHRVYVSEGVLKVTVLDGAGNIEDVDEYHMNTLYYFEITEED